MLEERPVGTAIHRRELALCEECAESQLLLTRRGVLGVTAGLFSWAFLPRDAEAVTTDPRFVIVVLRGGMDSLTAVVPFGDPQYISARGQFAIAPSDTIQLNGFFGAHPALKNFGQYYAAGDAAVVHAVCVPFHNRSHFDCQDNLENGLPGLSTNSTGWLNRLLTALPAGAPIKVKGAIEIGQSPLILRGPAPILGWSPSRLDHVKDPLLGTIRALYSERDRQLSDSLEAGLKSIRIAEGGGIDNSSDTPFVKSFRGAGRLVASPVGPRIAVVSVYGWDTHIGQGTVDGKLSKLLDELDYGLGAFKAAAGPAWASTVVAIVTEFGRTVHINGDEGTDHGIATVALLAGGAVNGRRVIANWPGLATPKLYEARDLKPTTDLRSVFKGILRDHLGVPSAIINNTVFPDSTKAPPLAGLIKTS